MVLRAGMKLESITLTETKHGCEIAGLQFLCESQSIVLLRNKGENTYSGGKYMHIIHVAYKQLIYQYLLYCNKTF